MMRAGHSGRGWQVSRGVAATWLALAALAPVLAVAAPAAVISAPPRFPDPIAGQRLLLQKGCANCHGILGPGGRQGPDLFRTARGKGAAELLADMWNHIPQMVSALLSGDRLPSLSAGELRDLVGYLNFVNYLGDVGDAQRGQALLAEMSCLGCHDLGRRGKIGPALIVPGRAASPVGLITDVWNHYPRMHAALGERGLGWFPWTGDVVTDLSRYLSSIPADEAPAVLLAPGDPAQGVSLFRRLGCAGCHNPARGASWVAFVRVLNRESAAENGAALLRHLPRLEETAGRTTQALRPLSEKEMADLLAYLSLAGAELPGGDPSKGRAVFEQKRCSGCHALPGARPGIGPDVEDMPPIADPYAGAALMLQHARDMKLATELKHVPWPQVEPEELQDLYAYLSKERRK
jgi:cytochrome c551/c552